MNRWLPVIAEAVPATLQALPAVLWRAERRGDGKPTKVPYRVADPWRRASSTDPATWSTFVDAWEAWSALEAFPPDPVRGPVAGVGVVLTREANVTCIDLDGVIDAQGQLDVRADTVVNDAASFTEVSPSGTGLHVFVQGCLPEALKGRQFEAYSAARFIAVTGHRWPGTPAGLRDGQAYLDLLYRRAQQLAAPRPTYTGPRRPPPDDLAGALLARLAARQVPVARLKRWADGYLVELVACPWADEHTTGPGGAAVMIRASGAWDFTCQHAHCGGRRWREFRARMEYGAPR